MSQNIRIYSWSAGLSQPIWAEPEIWLANPEACALDAIRVQETHWVGVEQFRAHGWTCFCSGTKDKADGVMVLPSPKISDTTIRWREVMPGRPLEARCHIIGVRSACS